MVGSRYAQKRLRNTDMSSNAGARTLQLPQLTGADRDRVNRGDLSGGFSYMLTRRPSLSSWSMDSCLTMPLRFVSWWTTTARCHRRTSGVRGELAGWYGLDRVTSGDSARPLGDSPARTATSTSFSMPVRRSSIALMRRTLSAAAASSIAALANIWAAAALPCVASIHCTHVAARGSKMDSSAPLESSATCRMQQRTPLVRRTCE